MMNRKEEKILERIDEIWKQLCISLIFFSLGMLLAWLGFSHYGDRFMRDIWNESVGRWPVYLLFGSAFGGLYLTFEYVADVHVHRRSNIKIRRFGRFVGSLLVMAPVLFVIIFVYRLYELRKLHKSLPDDWRRQ